MKLTKLELFIQQNPNMAFDTMATQLNRSYASIERTYERLAKKRRIAQTAVDEIYKATYQAAQDGGMSDDECHELAREHAQRSEFSKAFL